MMYDDIYAETKIVVPIARNCNKNYIIYSLAFPNFQNKLPIFSFSKKLSNHYQTYKYPMKFLNKIFNDNYLFHYNHCIGFIAEAKNELGKNILYNKKLWKPVEQYDEGEVFLLTYDGMFELYKLSR